MGTGNVGYKVFFLSASEREFGPRLELLILPSTLQSLKVLQLGGLWLLRAQSEDDHIYLVRSVFPVMMHRNLVIEEARMTCDGRKGWVVQRRERVKGVVLFWFRN